MSHVPWYAPLEMLREWFATAKLAANPPSSQLPLDIDWPQLLWPSNAPLVFLVPTEKLSESARQALGSEGVERFTRFLGAMEEDEERWASAVQSAALLDSMFNSLGEWFGVTPSVFLMDSAAFQLQWEDHSDGTVEVEFGPSRIEYFMESTGEEGHLSPSGIDELAHRVRETWAGA